MKAAVVEKPGSPEVLVVQEVPLPEVKPGWVLIRVKAFGLNRSELFTRQGHSPAVRFPRILGIECVGEIAGAGADHLPPRQQVAAIMGGMGRTFDGSYAEYVSVPIENALPFRSHLDWAMLAAIPEMFQTVYGSLHDALRIKPGETILIRGGTSSIGMTAIQVCKSAGLQVIATTRNPAKVPTLQANGADLVLTDDGAIAAAVHAAAPRGVEKVLELVGTKTLLDSLQCAKPGGTVCMTGILGNEWVLQDFEPMRHIPSTVRLTCYMGDTQNLTAAALQEILDQVEAGTLQLKTDRVFNLDEIVAAHQYMESNSGCGKLVVRV